MSSSTIRWREGPDFSLSVPVNCKKKETVVVRDSWMMKEVSRNPVHSWESWLLDADVFSPQSEKNLTGDVSTSGKSCNDYNWEQKVSYSVLLNTQMLPVT